MSVTILIESLPTRECGLKFFLIIVLHKSQNVTPYAGVWIEIFLNDAVEHDQYVTPYAGVWIEIFYITFL